MLRGGETKLPSPTEKTSTGSWIDPSWYNQGGPTKFRGCSSARPGPPDVRWRMREYIEKEDKELGSIRGMGCRCLGAGER